jgi:PAS domain S-box-containing protein
MEQINYQASLLDQVRNAVIATDLKGNIVYWNKFAEVLHQWTAEEALGRSIAETTVPEGRIGGMHEVMGKISRVGYYEGELPGRRKDGSIFPAYYIFNVLKDTHGQNIGLLGISTDITERKRAEEDLRKSKEKAESATKAKSQFLANMSHEIRTPMNAIIGLTGLLLNTEMTAEQRDYIETIRGSGDALLAIINDILDFSKIDEGKMEIERQPFDLVDCIEASLDLVAQSAIKKGLSLSYSISSLVPKRILGDVTRLRQVLVNLLSNAIKFTDHGDISLVISCQPGNPLYEIEFSVSDTGIGISQDRMDRLFQTFSQVDASMTRKYGGTGLGLAISKRLVELMGGRIWAESVPGRGSTFYFTILARAAPGPSLIDLAGKSRAFGGISAEDSYVEQLNLSKRGVGPQRILLAEDNAVNQKVAMRMLERLGYRADAVANGLEALQALERQPYDLVLMDVQMPEMDGLEATRRIREMPEVRQPYIIAMTAYALKGDREECMAAGMDDYVSKPVRMEELQAALMRIIGRRIEGHAIDRQALSNLRKLQMEGEPDIIQELGSMFLDRTPARIGTMRDAIAMGDAKTLKREAHNLKSSSANLGALRLSDLCKDLELLGRLGDLGGAMDLMDKAEEEFGRVRKALGLEISGQIAKPS